MFSITTPPDIRDPIWILVFEKIALCKWGPIDAEVLEVGLFSCTTVIRKGTAGWIAGTCTFCFIEIGIVSCVIVATRVKTLEAGVHNPSTIAPATVSALDPRGNRGAFGVLTSTRLPVHHCISWHRVVHVGYNVVEFTEAPGATHRFGFGL